MNCRFEMWGLGALLKLHIDNALCKEKLLSCVGSISEDAMVRWLDR